MKHTRILTVLALVAAAAGIALLAAGREKFAAQALVMAGAAGLMLLAFSRPRATETVPGRAMDAAKSGRTCTFDDVAANAEALESLRELTDYLKAPEKYQRLGARMPSGVLLYGPPGTGKTLLARALAGEAGVPFFALSGSDFVEKYVGVGAGRVRDLFRRARKAGRCVIFIDEIDALGKRRDETASDERDQTLNALLSEMSGFYTGDGVIVMAATNRVEALDPALLRPGRFDRQIEVGLPGREERLSILKLHSRNKPLSENVNLEDLARQTARFSGASLERLLNDAALLAARRGAQAIEAGDLRTAFYRAAAGADRVSAASESDRRAIAVHEAGHALISRILSPENHLARVSILPAGHGAAGYNLTVPEERAVPDKRQIENQIRVLLAGRAAEVLTLGEDAITVGAASDLQRATELAAAMVTELGMAGEPAVSLKALSRAGLAVGGAGERCRELLEGHYQAVKALLSRHREAMIALRDELMARESLDGEAAERLIDGALSSERQDSPQTEPIRQRI